MNGEYDRVIDIHLTDAAIEKNKVQQVEVNQAIRRLEASREALLLNAQRLDQDKKNGLFELMLCVSYRRFCKITGI